MTLLPTLLAPMLVLLVTIGGLLLLYVTDHRAKREPAAPSRKVGRQTFAKPPMRAKRKKL